MNNILEYKGYHTKVEFDSKDFVLRGKIEGINDFVNFECENINEVKNAFKEAVDDYLEFCKEVGKEPEKEYKGTFNIRIEPELHKKIAILASKRGETLNSTVQRAIAEYVLSENSKDRVEIYEPDSLDDYSGQFMLRLPKSLHRSLAENSKREGISMNQYCVYLLSRNDALHTKVG